MTRVNSPEVAKIRRFGWLFPVLVLSISLLAVYSTAGTASDSTPASSTVEAGAPLANTTLGLGTGIQALDMLSPTIGYAIATNTSSSSKTIVALVRTTDGGKSWIPRSSLPPGPFTQTYSGLITTIVFINPRVGYVVGALPSPGTILMTLDAGLTWKRVVAPGTMANLVVTHSTVAVLSDLCAPHQSDTNLCPNGLTLYRVASTKPESSVVIPKLGHLAWHNAAPLAAISPTTFVVIEGSPGGGGEAAVQSMLMTTDAGLSWHRIGDPCGNLATDQLLVTAPGHWLLSCFLGEGMNQGMSRLCQTRDNGALWTIVALNRDNGRRKGNIGNGGGEFSSLSLSGNHRLIFGAVGGPVGGVQYSVDGGVNWTWTDIHGQGGASESLSTFGPTGAIDDVFGGLIYRTTNGTKWTALPLLPAGKYWGLSTCTSGRDVAAHFVAKHVQGIPGDYPIVFTNDGDTACYLAGSPTVQPVAGINRHSVGPTADQNDAYNSVTAVILEPHGGTASISLLMNPTSSYPTTSSCDGKSVTGLNVIFNRPATFYVPVDGVNERVCTSIVSTIVNSVVSGTSGHSS